MSAKYSGILTFFHPKEFIGEVIKIYIYRADERRVKGGGVAPLMERQFEAEIIVKNEKGKTLLRVFPNGDAASRLYEGDTIAILRFINEPIVIKGKYWKTKL